MSETLLVTGSVVVIAALAAVLSAYLYLIGSVVGHIAETLAEKVEPGAREVGEHVAAIGPAATELRRRLSVLRQSRAAAKNAPTNAE
ncbi:hypothetical protein [Saccharopolyspora phatthalungensis]|uniref:Uncharacterized protein n=1 Tax=Saccharopolyspora phatthalungensis TaxID=664693 RepID=A0A840QF33_9PSEU|nr:hypothetical protein [Saccharopolyspora phatthalungensis]MBB5159036.1 hypothetical protein [Saccharopolyspora phatthalungensis]